MHVDAFLFDRPLPAACFHRLYGFLYVLHTYEKPQINYRGLRGYFKQSIVGIKRIFN